MTETKNGNPTRRQILAALGVAAVVDAKHANNPYHNKERDAERKRVESLKYDRNVLQLHAEIESAYKETHRDGDYALKLLVIDTDAKVWHDTQQANIKLDEELTRFFDGDHTKAHRHLAYVNKALESQLHGSSLSSSLCLFEHAQQFDKVILLNPLKSREFNKDYRYGDGFVAEEASHWGYHDNTNKPIYQAFYDCSAAGQCLNNLYTLDGTYKDEDGAELLLRRNQFADAFATLMMAKQYHTTYPARVVAHRRAVRQLHAADHTMRFADMPERIPSAVPVFTSSAILMAAQKADEWIHSKTIDRMTSGEMIAQARAIVEQPDIKMGKADILNFAQKMKKAKTKLRVLDKHRIEEAFQDRTLFNPQNVLDRVVMESYPFLFDQFNTVEHMQARSR